MADIKVAGFGGQGVLTAGKLLVDIAASDGKEICWTSSYGAAMRGGTASCTCIISDEEIGTPYPAKLDILLAMNEPSYEKYKNDVREGGWIIINSSLVNTGCAPENVHTVKVDATNIAIEVKNDRGANLIMIGAMIKATGIFDVGRFENGLKEYFEKKKHPNPLNLLCYELGVRECETVR